jgi:hypothetical protein
MEPTTDILMIDPLPTIDYSEDTVIIGRWRSLYDVVPRGRPPITFDDVDASRDGRLLTSFFGFYKIYPRGPYFLVGTR